MRGLAAVNMNPCTESQLLSVIRAMAEDLLRLAYPQNKCPTHGVIFLIRDKNGKKRCTALGCSYEVPLDAEPTISALMERYINQTNAS